MGAVHQCAAESEIVSQDFHKCCRGIGHLEAIRYSMAGQANHLGQSSPGKVNW